MATKNFSQMTTKKLQALMETASDEDKAAIQAVLDSRAQAELPAGQGYVGPEPEEENEEVYEKAAENGGSLPKKSRMTDEERIALAAELRETSVNHKCEVVPFNTAEWVPGVVTGIVEDKRQNKVLYAVKLEDGRRVVKTYDSNLIKIFDEVVEKTIARRAGTRREKVEKEPWTPETMEAAIQEVAVNVGKMVSYKEGEDVIEGRIISIVPDKRSQRCLYRIEIAVPTEEDPKAVKFAHKVSTLEDLVIAEDFDEKGTELNEKFLARRANAANREPITPESKMLKAEEALKKAEEAFAKASANLDARKAALEAAKAEYDAYLASQESNEPAGAAEENEPLA